MIFQVIFQILKFAGFIFKNFKKEESTDDIFDRIENQPTRKTSFPKQSNSYFDIIFNILNLVNGVGFIFKGNPQQRIQQIMHTVKEITRKDDLNDALVKLESNAKLRDRVNLKLQRMYRQSMKLQDMSNARKRDVQIMNMGGRNVRANFIVGFSVFGIVFLVGVLLYFKDGLGCDMIEVLSSILKFMTNILNDVSIFEFGSNLTRR